MNDKGIGWRAWPYAAAAAWGGLIGRMDFNSDDAGITAGLLFLGAALLGAACPKGAWRWGVLIGAGVPVTYAVLRGMGQTPRFHPQPGDAALLITLVPALLGAFLGAGLRCLASPPDNTPAGAKG